MKTQPPTIYLFGGCNGAGKTTFARAYLTVNFPAPLRFLNADEIARGLSPLAPERVALKAGKLLLSEIELCLKNRETFGLESTLSGHAQAAILTQAKSLGYRIEIFFLWIPSPQLAIKRIAQRVKKGGHRIRSEDVTRRYKRGLVNFIEIYAPLADLWKVWDNANHPPSLTLSSENASAGAVEGVMAAMKTQSKSGSGKANHPKAQPDDRDVAAAKAMEKALLEEHKRWNMPLLSWKDAYIIKKYF